MNKEDIKQAAAEYRNDLLCDAALEVNYEENNYDAGYNDCIVEEIPKAFTKGAEWRINSVWHDVKENPEDDRTYLAEFNNGTCCMFYNNLYFNRMADAYRIIRWAYTDDLLPERKEDAE